MSNGDIIATLDGWNVKQYLNEKVDRWYVTISQNSPFAQKIGRHRLLRSHFNYMVENAVFEIPIGFVVHHRDHDRYNDDVSNLVLMTESEHNLLHREFASIYGGSSFRGRRHKPDTIEKMKEIAKARGNNDIWDCPKTHHFEDTKALMSEKALGSNNAMFRADISKEAVTDFYLKCKSLKETAGHFGCSVSAIRYRLDRSIYEKKKNPLAGRERTYRFDNAEMSKFYEEFGAVEAAKKYGCTAATIYYRLKEYRRENT